MKIADVLYYLFLFIMFLLKGIGLYDGQAIYRILFWIAMLCVAGKIVLTNYRKREWVWVILLGLLSIMIERNSGEKGVLITYAIVVGMKGINIKRIMQLGAYTYGITLCAMITYFGIFLEKSTNIIEYSIGYNGVIEQTVRYGLGYAHPNTLMVTYLATITMFIICLGEKYNWKHAIALVVSTLYLYWYCISDTALITSMLMTILPLYLMKIRKGTLGAVEYVIGNLALPLSLIYSFLAPFLVPQKILDYLLEHYDTLYSRLTLPKKFVIPENISLLGTHISKVTTEQYALDNSFLYSFVLNGVIFTVIIVVMYFYMMHRFIKEKRNIELIVTCIFLLEALMEPFMFNTSFKNITLFFLGELIWDKSKSDNGRFDHISLTLPSSIIVGIDRLRECWHKNVRIIFVIALSFGMVVFVISIFANIFYTGGGVTSDTLRSCVANMCGGGLTLGIFAYVGCYIKECCFKRKRIIG